MTILRCCIVDDEPLARDLIASYIGKTPFMELAGSFGSAQEAVKTIIEESIDVIFLDINMPQLNGMEFARIVPPTCRIVFTTAYDKYAIEGFKVGALDFLLKPVSYEEFIGSANRALAWSDLCRRAEASDTSREYIMVKSEYRLVQIPVRDIIFIEGVKDYVKIYVDGEEKAIMTLMNMKTLERTLPSNIFLRVHRSYIINATKIRVIERNRILFGRHAIPVSDSYKQQFSDYIAAHMLTVVRDSNDDQ
ncbi:LytR/AlgR family response regulator transcription factor [Muribaculum intestinale]|uniref:Response regulator transcription factor n=1 Tax=Muribaculum intestinale TaxID=1796646 RepID=A0A4S2FYA2_9BACT|nr:LytTR family DNA-binding domain-containing protein [Muribaculum intestinale]MYM12322.1 response regulator [Muribaculum intestinale]TGY74453.1 response regulator transcription factor [Muribaculum intestinale]